MMSNGYKSTGQGLDGNSSPTPQEGNYISRQFALT